MMQCRYDVFKLTIEDDTVIDSEQLTDVWVDLTATKEQLKEIAKQYGGDILASTQDYRITKA